MIHKIFKVMWYVSVLALVADMLYVYASLPANVLVMQNGVEQVTVPRELTFNIVFVALALINVLVFVAIRLFKGKDGFLSWFIGLIITVNIFFVAAFTFIGIFNSGEHYDFSRMGKVVYGTIVLLVLWALSWPVHRLVRRFKVQS